MIADFIILIHFGFILFVIFGGLLLMKWQKLIWLHIPAAIWGMLFEFYGWVCPLTTLENELRLNTHTPTYNNSFIEHYLVPIIYPTGLTRENQIVTGVLVIIINLFIYI